MQSKWIMFSRTVWGAVLMGLGAASQFLGWTWWSGIEGDLNTVFNLVLEAAGLVLNLWGRIGATRPVHFIPKIGGGR